MATAFVTWICKARFDARRNRCRSLLRSIGCVIGLYAEDHGGAFPPDLSALLPAYISTPGLLKCPGVGFDKTPPSGQRLEEWSDYLYVYWPQGQSTPKDYPLLYDRRLSNHCDAICVLLVGGAESAGPKFELLPPVWDDGSWLQSFAREHSQYSIVLPDDIE